MEIEFIDKLCADFIFSAFAHFYSISLYLCFLLLLAQRYTAFVRAPFAY